jgi:dihydrofolate synthase/folylpolyglutamate synthase
MLAKIGPVVNRWYFTDLPTARAARAADLAQSWSQVATALPGKGNVPVSLHATPQEALDQAVAAAGGADRIVVFGSFYTVGGVLEHGTPRLQAKHLGFSTRRSAA